MTLHLRLGRVLSALAVALPLLFVSQAPGQVRPARTAFPLAVAVHAGTMSPLATRTEKASSLAMPGVYVAIGASDSYGVGTADPATQSWPAVLDGLLPPATRFVNLGVPGITLQRALLTELPIALDARPSLVTVFLGLNDIVAGVSTSSYEADLSVLLGALRRHTRARVLVANLPDLAFVPSLASRPGLGAIVASWNTVISTEVKTYGDILVDLHAHWRDLAAHPEYVGPDGLHPSAEGYRHLAALFWQSYRAALSR